jgi:CSLREA domain-containing protein
VRSGEGEGSRFRCGDDGRLVVRSNGCEACPRRYLTVNSTADPGTGGCNSTECTLREAINVSNGLPTTETINFNVPDGPAPGLEVKTISPASVLPTTTGAVTINGYTQPGAEPNDVATNANNAVLKIELSGRRRHGQQRPSQLHLRKLPALTSASATTIEGTLNSRPGKTFTIQFFSNPAPNFPTGFGEGETFLGEKTVTTNDRGRVSFTFATSLTAGEFV